MSANAETFRICSQRCCLFGLSATSLRPHHWRPCNTALVALARTCGFQGGRHGISRATWSLSTISEPANPYCRPTWSSPTSVIVYPFTPCSVIPYDPPLDGARFLLQHPFSETLCHWTSSHHPLWLFFVNGWKHFYFVNRFLTFYCSFTVHAFVVSVIVFIWATLKNLHWLIDWSCHWTVDAVQDGRVQRETTGALDQQDDQVHQDRRENKVWTVCLDWLVPKVRWVCGVSTVCLEHLDWKATEVRNLMSDRFFRSSSTDIFRVA